MTETISFSSPAHKPEFIIYAFQKDELSKGSPVWEALKVLDDENDACRIADILFKNDKFTRIEVRRKGEAEPVKVCDSRPSSINKLYFMMSAACFCAIAAGILAVYK